MCRVRSGTPLFTFMDTVNGARCVRCVALRAGRRSELWPRRALKAGVVHAPWRVVAERPDAAAFGVPPNRRDVDERVSNAAGADRLGSGGRCGFGWKRAMSHQIVSRNETIIAIAIAWRTRRSARDR